MSWIFVGQGCNFPEYDTSTDVSTPTGGAFSDDGLKMFVVDFGADDVSEYSLSTAYDITTASYTDSFSVSSQTSVPRDICFGDGGQEMYITSSATGQKKIFQYTLSTGYDVSTASYTAQLFLTDATPLGLDIKPDGSKIYYYGNQQRQVYEYDLSTNYDITSASLNQQQTFRNTSAEAGFSFNSDGTRCYIGENGNIYQYSLSSAYDISTESLYGIRDVSNCDASFFNSVFIGSATDRVYVVATQSDKILEVTI